MLWKCLLLLTWRRRGKGDVVRVRSLLETWRTCDEGRGIEGIFLDPRKVDSGKEEKVHYMIVFLPFSRQVLSKNVT
jgi:hypothetical protein